LDQGGSINYTEFLTATMDKKNINDEKLKEVFGVFDIDNSGSIDRKELRLILGIKEGLDLS